MIINERLKRWLNHRFGIELLPEGFDNYKGKSLDNNVQSKTFIETYGNSEIPAYKGFIDLKGFSNFCIGKTSREVRDFSSPFLNDIIKILTNFECLIDKTIGDEVMFVLPHKEETQIPTQIILGQIIGSLKKYAFENNNGYKFRVGISYGNLYLDRVGNESYSEWAVFGEPIITAKRLMSLDEVKDPNPMVIILGKNDNSEKSFLPELESVYNMSCFLHNNHQKIEKSNKELKGGIKVTYTYFSPEKESKVNFI